MLIRVLDRAEQVGVTLIRESGEELRGVMDHGERAGGRLICRIGSETRDTIELAIDKAAGKVQLLTDNLAEKAQLLLQGAGVEARLCLDHMQKNVAWSCLHSAFSSISFVSLKLVFFDSLLCICLFLSTSSKPRPS